MFYFSHDATNQKCVVANQTVETEVQYIDTNANYQVYFLTTGGGELLIMSASTSISPNNLKLMFFTHITIINLKGQRISFDIKIGTIVYKFEYNKNSSY